MIAVETTFVLPQMTTVWHVINAIALGNFIAERCILDIRSASTHYSRAAIVSPAIRSWKGIMKQGTGRRLVSRQQVDISTARYIEQSPPWEPMNNTYYTYYSILFNSMCISMNSKAQSRLATGNKCTSVVTVSC